MVTKLWIHRFVFAVILIGLFSFNISAGAQAQQQQDLPPTNPRLPSGFSLRSTTPTGLVLDLQAPAYTLETVSSLGLTCQRLQAAAYTNMGGPGAPALLSAGVMLGISTDEKPSYKILSIETIDLPQDVALCPAASLQTERSSDGEITEQGEVLTKDSTAYSQDAFQPSQVLELTESGMIRSQSVARLRFSPFQYNPARQTLRVVKRIQVELNLGITHSPMQPVAVIDEGPFEPLLQEMLLNYEQARPWRTLAEPAETIQPFAPVEQPAYKIQVNQDGVYQVSYAALQTAGVPVATINPITFKIYNQGVEIPIFLSTAVPGTFQSGDYFLFYGQKATTIYTNTNVYWLVWGGANGLRMAELNGTVQSGTTPPYFRTTLHLEDNLSYFSAYPSGSEKDRWYWTYLYAYNTSLDQNYPFTIPNKVAGQATVRVRGLIKGYYGTPQHHTRVLLNGNLVAEATWDSLGEYSFSVDVPQSFLLQGANTLTVNIPLDNGISVDSILINWFEIEYDRTYTTENNQLAFTSDLTGAVVFPVGGFTTSNIEILDITNPLSPSRIVGGSVLPDGLNFQMQFQQQISGARRFLALTSSRWLSPASIALDNASSLKSPTNGADYILISHANFLSAIQPLADYRASQGYRVKVVDAQDIYDEFNEGIFDPNAIHSFLAYIYSQWVRPAPAFVLLVGDGNYDYKNYRGTSPINFIPPYMADVDPWIGETAADNRYVTVSGSDILPDFFLGRLPANTPAEATAMVEKILSYEISPPSGDWNSSITFVADNADSGGNFPLLSNNIADHEIPPGYTIDKIYYGSTHPTVSAAQTAILEAINQGRLIVHYTGHASVIAWAGEKLLATNQAPDLTNKNKYAFMMPMTCSEGYFVNPNSQFSSVSESFLRTSDKGSIGSWSPTGLGLSSGHDILAQGFYDAIFDNSVIQIGPATNYGKAQLYASGAGYLDLIDTYTLFGDPATRLKTTPTAVTFVDFHAQQQPDAVELFWETANENWLVGFNLFRSESEAGTRQKLNSDLIPAKKTGQMDGAEYSYTDSEGAGESHYYWLEMIQVDGTEVIGPLFVGERYWNYLPEIRR